MPELPEVETVRRGLAPVLVGRTLSSVVIGRPDLRFPFPERFADRLTGLTVVSIDRRAKYLIWTMTGGVTLIVHLGMTGRFTVGGGRLGEYVHDTGLNPKHDHIRFELDDGGVVTYNDPRRFGFVDLLAEGMVGDYSGFRGMGPEPLSEDFSAAYLKAAFARRRGPVKQALLDQTVVAGLGNIYVAEALFRSRINPLRPAVAIGVRPLGRLVSCIKEVIGEAIAAGGSSISDFASTDGAAGRFQMSFNVYGREGDGCSVCGQPILRIVQSGRSTFFCPRCQR
jgi:formamidopyrimidine-DNA glycosylase